MQHCMLVLKHLGKLSFSLFLLFSTSSSFFLPKSSRARLCSSEILWEQMVFKRKCEHNHSDSKLVPEKTNKWFYCCVLCGAIFNEKKDYFKHLSSFHKKELETTKFCRFCKKNLNDEIDDLIDHHISHLNLNGFLKPGMEIRNLSPSEEEDDFNIPDCSNEGPIADSDEGLPEEPNSDELFCNEEPLIPIPTIATADPQLQIALNTIPIQMNRTPSPGILAIQTPESEPRLSNEFFLSDFHHSFYELPKFCTNFPFLPKEAPLFSLIMRNRMTKAEFDDIVKTLPEVLNIHVPQNSKLLAFQRWERVEELTSFLKIPQPWKVFKRCPIYSISDYLRRLAEMKCKGLYSSFL